MAWCQNLRIDGGRVFRIWYEKKDGGVAFAELSASCEASRLGFKSGDLVQGLNENKVTNLRQLFKALATISIAPVKVAVVRNQENLILSVINSSYVAVEFSDSLDGFAGLTPSVSENLEVSTNRGTSNEPIGTLTDGKLARNFGAVFGNGIYNGAYKAELGESKPVVAITSWSFQKGARGTQKVTLYGSNSAADPGWNIADRSRFQPLGSIDTSGLSARTFTAASLRASDGQSLGTFRWIVWRVTPVTSAGGGENTAMQELAIEFAR